MINQKQIMSGSNHKLLIPVLFALLVLAACTGDQEASISPVVPDGDPVRGRQVIQDFGCGSCHTIPGIPNANADVGPPLNRWADRSYIAGSLINTPDNLIHWIRFPQEVEPGTAMPNMGISEGDARDISAYLFTLRRSR